MCHPRTLIRHATVYGLMMTTTQVVSHTGTTQPQLALLESTLDMTIDREVTNCDELAIAELSFTPDEIELSPLTAPPLLQDAVNLPMIEAFDQDFPDLLTENSFNNHTNDILAEVRQ